MLIMCVCVCVCVSLLVLDMKQVDKTFPNWSAKFRNEYGEYSLWDVKKKKGKQSRYRPGVAQRVPGS
jgi:hypothetical protein